MKKKTETTSYLLTNALFCGGTIAVMVSTYAMGWPSMALTAGIVAVFIAYKRA